MVRQKSDGTVAVLAWACLLCFRYIPIITHRAEKSNILFKSRCNFRPHVELVDIRSRMLHVSHDRIVRLSTFDRTSQGIRQWKTRLVSEAPAGYPPPPLLHLSGGSKCVRTLFSRNAGNDIEHAVLVHLLRCYQKILHMDIQKLAQRVTVIHVRQ